MQNQTHFYSALFVSSGQKEHSRRTVLLLTDIYLQAPEFGLPIDSSSGHISNLGERDLREMIAGR